MNEIISNYGDLEKEYSMLREEIRGNSANLLRITQFTLPVAVSIIVYAWTSNQGFIALVNILLAYSMIFKQMQYRQSTFRNATYCEVFLEPYMNRKWETRLHRAEKLQRKDKKKWRKWNYINEFRFFEWVAVEIVSFIVVGIKWSFKNLFNLKFRVIVTLIVGAITVGHTVKYISDLSNIQKGKETYKNLWNKVKSEE